ncbi:MAG: carbohydrate ABC transporter permease [Motilibacteraceae bacterium]
MAIATTDRRARRADLPAVRAWSRWINGHVKWVFAAPAMAFVAVLIVFPVGWTVFLSLTDAEGSVRAEKSFVGLSNYLDVLTDTHRFWPAVLRTGIFTGVALALELVLGLAVALLLWRPFRGEKWVRAIILMPLVATPVAVGMMWRLILDPNIGFANAMLGWVGIPPQPWLSSPSSALVTTALIDVWQWTPMVALILLAGLTSLSDEPQEAALVDGASAWQRFRHVTLPLLAPTLVVAVLLRGIDAIKTFDILYSTKGKGGGSFHEVETLNVYAYGLSFDYNEYGIASAVLIIFFLLIVACMWLVTARAGRDS